MDDPFEVLEDGRVRVASGSYYLGDPCHAFPGRPDDAWERLLHSCDNFAVPVGIVGEIRVLAFPTEYGDGCYACGEMEIGVDSGLIGLVPASASEQVPDGMFLVGMKEGDVCSASGGTMCFGTMTVSESEEEEVDEDEEDPETDETDEVDKSPSLTFRHHDGCTSPQST